MQDRNGQDIRPGDRILWREHGNDRTGFVEVDLNYNGGLRVGGRSLNNIRDDADWLLVVVSAGSNGNLQ